MVILRTNKILMLLPLMLLIIGMLNINMIPGDQKGSISALRTRDGVQHSPIIIDGNSDLLSTASTEGWPGDGSEQDPIIISDYRIIAQGDYGIRIIGCDLHTVIENINVTIAYEAGIELSSCTNVTIKGNLIYAMISSDAIRLVGSSDCIITENHLDKDDQVVIGYNGIRLVDSPENSITNNIIARMVNDGILLSGLSDQNLIKGNHLDECSNIGIMVQSDHNLIINNSAFGNGWGIRVSGDNNDIFGNRPRSNGYGIYISNGKENTIKENIVTRNFIGIDLVVSIDNKVFDNYIAKSASFGVDLYCNSGSGNIVHSNHLYYNNGSSSFFDVESVQAFDLNPGNLWYNTTSGRGNFWFDWRGVDGNSDGIVDLSYPIVGDGTRDMKPLKNPTMPDVFHPPWNLKPHPQSAYIDITWNAPWYGPSVKIERYLIYRSERGGGELFLDSVLGTELAYRDLDVLPGRAYYYYIIAENSIALSNQSKRIKSSPDTISPKIVIDQPEDGDIFNNRTVNVLFTGSDNIALDRFEVSLDGEEPVSNGLFENKTFDDLTEGSHSVYVTAFDLAEHNKTAVVDFVVDVSNPFIKIDSNESGGILSRTISPTLTWVAGDNISGLDGFFISIDGDEFKWAGRNMEYTISDLLPGPHTVSIRVRDKAGNRVNDTVYLTVDPDTPRIDIISPHEFYINNTGTIPFKWFADDDISGISNFKIRWDSGDWIDIGEVREFEVEGLTEGSHHIYIRAFDSADNNISAERTVIVDMSPPEMEITHPEEGGLYNGEFNLQWSGTDLLTGITGTTLIIDDGQPQYFKKEQPIKISFPKDGTHTIELFVIDGAENTVSIRRTFHYDITQPTVTSFQPTGTGVNVSTNLMIGFSEDMDLTSISLDMEGVSGNFSWEGRNLTFDPSMTLEYGKKYSLRITGFDIAENPLVPFDWYFTTEFDLSEGRGMIIGRITDGLGFTISNASIRVRSGERTQTNETGWFHLAVLEGDNHLIVSFPGYKESKFDFSVEEGEILELGDIPIKMIPEEVSDEKKEGPGYNPYHIDRCDYRPTLFCSYRVAGPQVQKGIGN